MFDLIYAGIGSRHTPIEICQLMTNFALWANAQNLICSTGGAKGADSAFIKGAGDKLHNWLPFNGYNGYSLTMPEVNDKSLEMAKKFHPNWKACDMSAMMMHARNCNIVLGEYLINPVLFIVCWTKDGLESGGTGQALRLAHHHKIPVINLGSGDPIEKLEKLKLDIVKAFNSPKWLMFDEFYLGHEYAN